MNTDFEELLTDFLKDYRHISYRKGDIIIRGDDIPSGVYFVQKGTVKMSFIGKDGNELGVNILKPGAFFPMIWALGGVENTYFFQALSGTIAIKVPKEDFINFLKENPSLLYDLTRRLLVGMDGLLFNIKHILSGSATSKISVIIYSLARRFGVKKGDSVELGLNLTHQEIAHFAGLSRETTTIAINKLVKSGILEQTQRKILIRDWEGLQSRFK
jgi:CRP/FNR family cyclic AMP-dependent transcriptional regulator